MKRYLLSCLLLVCFTGCVALPNSSSSLVPAASAVTGAQAPRAFVNGILDALLPSTFSGPINATFFRPIPATLEAQGVAKNPSTGEWGFTYLRLTLSEGVASNVIELGAKTESVPAAQVSVSAGPVAPVFPGYVPAIQSVPARIETRVVPAR